MPRKTIQDRRFIAPDLSDLQRARRALELILDQEVSREDATDNVEVDRRGDDV